MISFRYHIVSLVAVFLALALGIVVGTTALSGPITRDLRKQVDDGKKQRSSLSSEVKTLQGQVDDAGQFATTYGAKLVSGSLTGKKVIEVVLPNVSGAMRSGIEKQLAAAGATVTGTVTVESDYLDAGQASGVISLATGQKRPYGWIAPETNDAGRIGGSLLSYILLGKGQSSDLTQVLSSFSSLHMLSVDGATFTPATNVVVIGSGAASSTYGGASELALVTALSDAKTGGKVVVAGNDSAAGSQGVVGLVRGASVRDVASTVDGADSPFGQVSTALALAGTIKGDVGQYGTKNGAEALFPEPAN